MEDLSCAENQVSDLTGLEQLTSLTYLLLSKNFITDLSPVTGLVHLQELRVFHNNITILPDLSNLKALTFLDLGYNPALEDINGLAGLTALTTLHLDSNNIQDSARLVATLASKDLTLRRIE